MAERVQIEQGVLQIDKRDAGGFLRRVRGDSCFAVEAIVERIVIGMAEVFKDEQRVLQIDDAREQRVAAPAPPAG